MSDSTKIPIELVKIEAVNGPTDYITNHGANVMYDNQVYVSKPEIAFGTLTHTGTTESKEFVISNIPLDTEVIIALAGHYPYPKVLITVVTAEISLAGVASNPMTMFKGKLYVATPRFTTNLQSLELVCKDDKYYSDVPGGVPCTEQCAAPFFGDGEICQKAPVERQYTIGAVDNTAVTVVEDVTEPDEMFNSGKMVYEGLVYEILYWKSGKTFILDRLVSESLIGKVATFSYGCDKTITNCRVHDNEARFLGLGIGMVSYDPNFATA